MSDTRLDSIKARPRVEGTPIAALPYPETDVASSARRAHDVVSEALKEARGVRRLLEANGDPGEAARRLGIASNSIGSAVFFLREAIAMKGVAAATPPGLREISH